jgi:hypothetical protein
MNKVAQRRRPRRVHVPGRTQIAAGRFVLRPNDVAKRGCAEPSEAALHASRSTPDPRRTIHALLGLSKPLGWDAESRAVSPAAKRAGPSRATPEIYATACLANRSRQ